ncbi:ROK family protein [Streptosporangium sp. NPDC049046]|uniref:ROK family protein n=1 Tax=Streptosporangium sp. NPDC049046 TaxID=3155031 RepID=UPI00343A4A12
MSRPTAIAGVDVGGTKIAVGVLHADGTSTRIGVEPTVRGTGEANAATVRTLLRRACDTFAIAAVGLSVTTTVDGDGRFRDLTSWIGWRGWTPADVLGDMPRELRDGGSVIAANDAACGALAEWSLGAGRGANDTLFVSLGTGLSHSLVHDGRVLTGAHGGALFSGYAPPARCPWSTCEAGTVEDICSGPALAEAYRGPGARDARPVLDDARDGVPAAGDVVDHAAWHLGAYLAGLVQSYDPEVVVIGGGLGTGAPGYVEPAVRIARDLIRLPFASRVPFTPAALGADSGWLGAALTAAHG